MQEIKYIFRGGQIYILGKRNMCFSWRSLFVLLINGWKGFCHQVVVDQNYCRWHPGAGGAEHGGEMPVDAHHLLCHQPAGEQPDKQQPAQVRGQKQWLCDKRRRGGVQELERRGWTDFPKVWKTAASFKSKSRGKCVRFAWLIFDCMRRRVFMRVIAGRWRDASSYWSFPHFWFLDTLVDLHSTPLSHSLGR